MTIGTFKPGEDKVRPGTYFTFKSDNPPNPNNEAKGTTLIPLELPWGSMGELVSITNFDNGKILDKLGYSLDHSILLPLKEALKAAGKVIVYPLLKGGVKATVTKTTLVVTATKPGVRGNDLSVVISANPLKTGTSNVEVFLENMSVLKIEGVTQITELTKMVNPWVVFTGTGNIPEAGRVALTGGTNGTRDNDSVTSYLNAIETIDCQSFAFPYTEEALKTSFTTKVKYLRETIGKRVQGVCSKNPADYEGIISVENGVILEDGTKLTPAQATYWVAGASAAAGSTGDLTYRIYPEAIDPYPVLTHNEIVVGLKEGKFMFSKTDGHVRVEEDINTLVTLAPDKDESYTDNRVIRTFDDFFTTCGGLLVPNKYSREEDGMDTAEKDIVNLLMAMEKNHTIKNVDYSRDVIIDREKSLKGKSLYVTVAIQPIRTYKKYYITVNSR